MRRIVFMMLALSLSVLAGCSTIKLVPQQVANGTINPADNSLSIKAANGIEVSARMDETLINSYNLDSFVTAFGVVIKNGTSGEISFADDSFVLVDETGLQYPMLTPESVRGMLKKDSYYLVPYPYVGFYYLEDYEKSASNNRFTSSLPYYYELYPQDIYTKSLQPVTVIPGMRVEGLAYFKVDPASHKQLTLMVYRKGVAKTGQPEFSFPFTIVK